MWEKNASVQNCFRTANAKTERKEITLNLGFMCSRWCLPFHNLYKTIKYLSVRFFFCWGLWNSFREQKIVVGLVLHQQNNELLKYDTHCLLHFLTKGFTELDMKSTHLTAINFSSLLFISLELETVGRQFHTLVMCSGKTYLPLLALDLPSIRFHSWSRLPVFGEMMTIHLSFNFLNFFFLLMIL